MSGKQAQPDLTQEPAIFFRRIGIGESLCLTNERLVTVPESDPSEHLPAVYRPSGAGPPVL